MLKDDKGMGKALDLNCFYSGPYKHYKLASSKAGIGWNEDNFVSERIEASALESRGTTVLCLGLKSQRESGLDLLKGED